MKSRLVTFETTGHEEGRGRPSSCLVVSNATSFGCVYEGAMESQEVDDLAVNEYPMISFPSSPPST